MEKVWIDEKIFGSETINNIKKMSEDELADAFKENLKFGTAGLRGKMGAGTNRMNVHTVKKAAVAIAKWIIKNGAADSGVVIGYDVRKNSDEFAKITAEVMEYYKINYTLLNGYTPTPIIAYSVLKYGYFCGIMVTASHNPKDYNGYKVYAKNGSQILNEDAEIIERFINELSYEKITNIKSEEIEWTDPEKIETDYFNDILSDSLLDDLSEMCVVYSPFNGCGEKLAKKILKAKKVKYFIPVAQEFRDENFTTINYPNPEVDETFDLSIELANKKGADLIITNDPDADRIRIAIKENGEFKILTGNELGALLCYFIVNIRRDKGFTNNARIVKTVVTDDLGKEIAERYGYDVKETLTGFKWISQYSNCQDIRFIMGYEESIGYQIGTEVHDKDGLSALLFVIDAYRYFRLKGMKFSQVMDKIYFEFGYHEENNFSIYFEEDLEYLKIAMNEFRNEFEDEFFGVKIIDKKDFLKSETPNMLSDLIIFYLKNNIKICIRPSGTEPKLKFYMYGVGENREDIQDGLRVLRNNIEKVLNIQK